MDFAVGDVVWLKSGGAPMTVGALLPGDQGCRCVWHTRTSDGFEEASAAYAEAMLTRSDPQAASPSLHAQPQPAAAPSQPVGIQSVPAQPGEYKVYEEGDD